MVAVEVAVDEVFDRLQKQIKKKEKKRYRVKASDSTLTSPRLTTHPPHHLPTHLVRDGLDRSNLVRPKGGRSIDDDDAGVRDDEHAVVHADAIPDGPDAPRQPLDGVALRGVVGP